MLIALSVNFYFLLVDGFDFQLAFISFEEEQKEQAIRALHETTDLCKAGSAKSRKSSKRKHMTEVVRLILYCLLIMPLPIRSLFAVLF